MIQGIPPLTIDLSSIVVSVVGVVLVSLAKRAVKGIDNHFVTVHAEIKDAKTDNTEKFKEVHDKMDKIKGELTGEIKDVRGDLVKHRDRTENLVTAARADLENKLEVHDGRLRDLEKGSNHV